METPTNLNSIKEQLKERIGNYSEMNAPDLLIDIKSALESYESETVKIKPDRIVRWEGKHQLRSILFQITHMLGRESDRKVIENQIIENPALGLVLDRNDLILTPVDIIKLINEEKNIPVLIHQGITKTHSVNNILQFSEKGIFGDTGEDVPTYVKTFGSKMFGNLPYTTHEKGTNPNYVTLYINPYKLRDYRSIFTDPEPLFSNIPSDKLGESFFVMGGIPAKSIIGVSDKSNGPLLLI